MKGFTKAIMRTPHMVTSKVGMSKKSADPEFDDYSRKFTTIEETVEKMLKECRKFNEAVVALFSSGQGFASHFAQLFHPLSGEYDLIGNYPQARDTIRNIDGYAGIFDELRSAVAPELELIESRIIGPVRELQNIMKQIRKNITKRDHKLIDYDRFNNSLTKLRDKKEKSLNDEKNLFKLEQDFEAATNEYEYINNAMKNDLPRFLTMCVQFIDPLYHSFYYMQLNIFYMMLEKLQSFAEGKYDVSGPASQVAADYEYKLTDAREQIEALNVTKRIVSTSKFVQSNRAAAGGLSPGASTIGRTSSFNSTLSSSSAGGPPSRASTISSAYSKKAPPPPPPSLGASKSFSRVSGAGTSTSHYGTTVTHDEPAAIAPPPYSPSSNPGFANAASVAAAKKRPPPPPPVKPKPKIQEPQVEYVVALYDFEPQADGDLGFNVGDRIEVVERTQSSEDWWTGKLNGKQGVFPGNYVQDA